MTKASELREMSDEQLAVTLKGSLIVEEFIEILNSYVDRRYGTEEAAGGPGPFMTALEPGSQ